MCWIFCSKSYHIAFDQNNLLWFNKLQKISQDYRKVAVFFIGVRIMQEYYYLENAYEACRIMRCKKQIVAYPDKNRVSPSIPPFRYFSDMGPFAQAIETWVRLINVSEPALED